MANLVKEVSEEYEFNFSLIALVAGILIAVGLIILFVLNSAKYPAIDVSKAVADYWWVFAASALTALWLALRAPKKPVREEGHDINTKKMNIYTMPSQNIIPLAGAFLAGVIVTYILVAANLPTSDIIASMPKISDYPGLSSYSKFLNCTPTLGEIHTVPGPGMALFIKDSHIIGVETRWPAATGWFPWAREQNGNPSNTSNRSSYSQRIFFVDPSKVTC